MQKVVMPGQMAQMDQQTIQSGVLAEELMERAGIACAEIIGAGLSLLDKVVVVCGGGNNGGDGFVIARILAEEGHPVRVLITAPPESYSNESRIHFQKLSQMEMPLKPELDEAFSDEELGALFAWSGVIVDCLFGNGLKDRPLTAKYCRIIDAINNASKPVTSIDIPSGLRGDVGLVAGTGIKAIRTIAIQCIKAGCLLNDGPDYCGELLTVDIGIQGKTDMTLFEHEDLTWPKPRKKRSHKYHYGVVAAVVGSPGMFGAGQMACDAAMTGGVGLVRAYVPESCFQIMALRMPPEVMLSSYEDDQPMIPSEDRKDVILFGCGVGQDRDYRALLQKILYETAPCVIDADGLRHFSKHQDQWADHQAPLILTPHTGELSILTGYSSAEIERDPIGITAAYARQMNAVVVLKGYRTVVCNPQGEITFNSTGNPGMSTAGSGDVLAGMIAGILAQGVSPLDAARHGVYYHGAAGDIFAGRFNETTMKATDILSFLKVVMNDREG